MAKNELAVYPRRILYLFCQTAAGIPTKLENVKTELEAMVGMGFEWQWLKIVYRGGLWFWRCWNSLLMENLYFIWLTS